MSFRSDNSNERRQEKERDLVSIKFNKEISEFYTATKKLFIWLNEKGEYEDYKKIKQYTDKLNENLTNIYLNDILLPSKKKEI